MIKLFEEYEPVKNHKYYVDLLHNKIRKYNYTINGFDLDYDFSGSFGWAGDEYYFYATPYWENEFNIPVDVYDINGLEVENYISSILPELKSEKDVDETIEIYLENIKKISKELNKRAEIINFLKKYKVIQDVEIKINGIYFPNIVADSDSINNTLYSDITTDNIIDIYSKIEKEKPELISSIKYNI